MDQSSGGKLICQKPGLGLVNSSAVLNFPAPAGVTSLTSHSLFSLVRIFCKADDLALVQRGAHLHKGAMRIHDDGVGFFREEGFDWPLPFHHHANLKKQALAASSV